MAPAAAVLAGPAERAYDLVLVDPPYEVPDAEVAGWLAAAAANGWLAADAVVVVERSARGGAVPVAAAAARPARAPLRRNDRCTSATVGDGRGP